MRPSRSMVCLGTLVVLAACGHGTAASSPELVAKAQTAPDAVDSGPPATVDAGTDAGPPAPFYCFAWVHLGQFATDCFRGAKECEDERLAARRGARNTTPACEPAAHASCARTTNPPLPGDIEHCFSDVGVCARYQAHVLRNGLKVTACEDF